MWPFLAVRPRFANCPPPSVATARPCHAAQLPRPSTLAVSGALNDPIVETTPPTGAVSFTLTSSLFCSGTASSFSTRRSPPAIPRPVNAVALVVNCARLSAMCTAPSIFTMCAWPVTGLAMTKRSIASRFTSMSRSGSSGAFGSVGVAFSTGRRCSVTSGVVSERTSTWLLANANGRQSTASFGLVRKTPLGSDTRTSLSVIAP